MNSRSTESLTQGLCSWMYFSLKASVCVCVQRVAKGTPFTSGAHANFRQQPPLLSMCNCCLHKKINNVSLKKKKKKRCRHHVAKPRRIKHAELCVHWKREEGGGTFPQFPLRLCQAEESGMNLAASSGLRCSLY